MKHPYSPCTLESSPREKPSHLLENHLQTNQLVARLQGSGQASLWSQLRGRQPLLLGRIAAQLHPAGGRAARHFGPGLFQLQTMAAARKSALAFYWTIWEPSGVSPGDTLGLFYSEDYDSFPSPAPQ